MTDKKEKQIEDYKQTKPTELELFQEIPLAINRSHYCNLIVFYDLIPKYVYSILKRKSGKFLDTIEKVFVHKGKKYQLFLQPARIKTKEGEKEFFPGKRERLIEDALRKIAMDSENNCMFFDGMIGLKFTISQLQKELKNLGCSSSHEEIKESLKICAKSIMEIKSVNGEGDEFNVVSALFSVLICNDRSQYENGQKYYFLQFHPFVTQAINNKEFRLYDYKKGMMLKGGISSYLYKRLCYNFTQAGIDEVYKINLTTIIRDAGFNLSLPLWKNFDKVKRSIKELIKKEIIKDVKYEHKKESRKTVEIVIKMIVTDSFSAKMMKSNFVKRELGTNP